MRPELYFTAAAVGTDVPFCLLPLHLLLRISMGGHVYYYRNRSASIHGPPTGEYVTIQYRGVAGILLLLKYCLHIQCVLVTQTGKFGNIWGIGIKFALYPRETPFSKDLE